MEFLQNNDFWFILTILLSFLLTAYYFFKGQELDRHGVRVEGIVTDYWVEEDTSGEDSNTEYYLKAYFTDDEAYVHTVKLNVSSSVYKQGKKTMALELVHPQGHPKKVRPKKALYTPAITWCVVLAVTVIMYVLYLIMT